MLPGKSGVELCRDLRARTNGDEMYILLVTARANPEDLEQALAAGANDYLTKPPRRPPSERAALCRGTPHSGTRGTESRPGRSPGIGAADDRYSGENQRRFLRRRYGLNFTYLNAEAEIMPRRSPRFAPRAKHLD